MLTKEFLTNVFNEKFTLKRELESDIDEVSESEMKAIQSPNTEPKKIKINK